LPGSPQPSHGYHRSSLGSRSACTTWTIQAPRRGEWRTTGRKYSAVRIEAIDPSPPQAIVVHADEIWLLIYSKAHVNVQQVPDGFLRQILYSTPSPQIDLQPHLPNTSTSPESWSQRGFCPRSANTVMKASQNLPNAPKRDHVTHNPNASSLVV
jgi:hypothetical protein